MIAQLSKLGKLAGVSAAFIAAQLVFASPASAHAVGTSYVTIDAERNSTEVATRVDLTLRDLEFAIGLDRNGDSHVTWGEVLSSSREIASYIETRLTIARGNSPCLSTPTDIAIDRHADEIYAVATFRTACGSAGPIAVNSSLLFDLDDSHRTLLTVNSNADSVVTVLTSGSREWLEKHTRFAAWRDFVRFVGQGVWHIWIGFDHLSFLMLLLLPLSRHVLDGGNAVRSRVARILKVVTAFTAAHSITLACAALGYVQLPSRWTEAAIAASIVVAAIANLTQRTDRFGVAMAFGFGLIHGLGFASALADITTNTANRIIPLVGFNLGVEIGQLVVVVAVFPFLFLGNRSPQFKQRAALVGSATLGALGLAWLLQRTVF